MLNTLLSYKLYIKNFEMELDNQTINWNSPNALHEIFNQIQSPLESIMTASKEMCLYNKKNKAQIIFSNSNQINNLIEEILIELKSNAVKLNYKPRPDIFEIFETNEFTKKICKQKIIPNNISKTDQLWLINLEGEVYKSINKNDLSIGELSYKMAVSERQLHRKVNKLVYLTPNKYIRVLKLHKAKTLLDNYVYDSITQISQAVGYNDTHYFSKLFHRHYNKHPKDLLLSS